MKVSLRVLAAVTATAAIVAGASAASSQPNVAGMTLGAADVPSAKVVSQGAVREGGYLSAYQRTMKLKTPYGRSLIIEVRSETLLAPSQAQVATDLAVVQRILKSKAGRAGFIAGVAGSAHVKPSAVKLSALRHPAIGDGTVEQPLSVQLDSVKAYESLLYMRLDRVMVELIVAGIRPVSQADSASLTRLALAHVTQALTPVDLTPPAITGTARSRADAHRDARHVEQRTTSCSPTSGSAATRPARTASPSPARPGRPTSSRLRMRRRR